MFYYYEIVSKPLTAECLPQEECPICAKKGGIEVTLYMRYTSALIPFFGMGRTTSVDCTFCGHEIKAPNEPLFKKKNYSPAVADAINNIRATHRRTLWQLLYPWSFFLLTGCLIIFGAVSTMFRNNNAANNKQLLENPKPGDIYKAMFDIRDNTNTIHSQFALVKLLRINNDTMYIVLAKQSIKFGFNESDWSSLSRKDDAFESSEYKISLQKFVDKSEPGNFIIFKDKVDISRTTNMGSVVGDNSGRMKVVERQ